MLHTYKKFMLILYIIHYLHNWSDCLQAVLIESDSQDERFHRATRWVQEAEQLTWRWFNTLILPPVASELDGLETIGGS